MTHYYYYIECGDVLDSTSTIYQVAIGSSKQAQRDFLYLTAFSVDNGHYFEAFSERSSMFVLRLLRQPATEVPMSRRVSARELVRHLKSGTAIVQVNNVLHTAHQQRKALDIGYRCQCYLDRRRASSSAKPPDVKT